MEISGMSEWFLNGPLALQLMKPPTYTHKRIMHNLSSLWIGKLKLNKNIVIFPEIQELYK